MKRFFSLLLILDLLCIAAGCGQAKKREAVLPPVRTAPGTMYMQLEKRHSVESAFEESDGVARVKIGNWLGESTEHHVTYFEATVLECFKGDMPQTFTLIQDGCSTVTQSGYPLFTASNELLLFLNKATGEDNYQPAYWIVGAHTTMVDVAYDTDGNRYYADRYGILCDDFFGCPNYTYNSTVGEELSIEKSIRAYLIGVDPFLETMDYSFPCIYRGADFENFLKGL